MKIINNLYCKVGFLLFITCVFCKVYAATEEDSQTDTTQINKPYFWRVEKDSKVSHFLGTIHFIISIDELPCSQEIQRHLENSDLVFVEHNHLLERNKKSAAAGKQLMLSKDGREFQALSKDSQEFLRNKGVSEQLNLYGYSKVLHHLCLHDVADVNGLILDNQITYAADSIGIPVQELDDSIVDRFLKTQREKADAFNRLSGFKFQLEVGFLNGDIKMFSYNCPFSWYMDRLEHYKSGNRIEDIKNIEKYLGSLTVEKRNEYILGWQTRNTQWLKRFEEAHQTHERIFLAGGLAHLIGPVNLMDMLKEKGYTIEPVTCKK